MTGGGVGVDEDPRGPWKGRRNGEEGWGSSTSGGKLCSSRGANLFSSIVIGWRWRVVAASREGTGTCTQGLQPRAHSVAMV